MFAYLLKCTALGAVTGAGISLARQELDKDPKDRDYYTMAVGAVVAVGALVTATVVIANKYNEHSE